ncbi:hypothetical protein [Goodfellowiella coeruleoviolacea]|uniref:Uncharacterized protein n=1 Tax=Goodfellowiella coeruleoviolacea TaxID=334858 RepID=A0AAE3GD17_9PSEU|nr:hypothetical protein [Goodfellowiella coeruleoviolacea]MCP2166061.1 hypothetical protein [Goodfellowiella coeruleoviolacea]
MSGSLEVRKFLWQQDDFTIRHSPTVPAQRTGEPSRVSDDQVHRARIAVARGAQDADDCRLLLDMLGLAPAEDGPPAVQR